MARFTAECSRDPETGELSTPRALSLRPAHQVTTRLKETDPTRLSDKQEMELREAMNRILRARKPVWYLKPSREKDDSNLMQNGQMKYVPNWTQYKTLSDEHAHPDAQAAARAELKHLQIGRALWTSAPQMVKDFDEYRDCCGNAYSGLSDHLRGMTAQVRAAHSSKSVLNMLLKRIEKRAAHASKAEFVKAVASELEASVRSVTAGSAAAMVAWDSSVVCHSCFRAVLGIGRSSLFMAKTRVNALNELHKAEKAAAHAHATGHTISKHFAPVLAGVKRIAFKPAYASRRQDRSALAKALLLAYCKMHGQHDPAGAGSTSLNRTTYVLPLRSETALHTALNLELRRRMACGEELESDDPLVRLPAPPDPGQPHPEVSKSTIRRVLSDLLEQHNVHIQMTKQKGVCRCTECDRLQEAITRGGVTEASNDVARVSLQSQLVDHLRAAQEQREFFDKMKAEAIRKPLDLWTMTFDGFDKSKTALPHRPRPSKEQDGAATGLISEHVVGVMMFGAPVPVMAFFNDESVAGGANLAATIVYEALEKQWLALITQYRTQRAQVEHVPLDLQAPMSESERVDSHQYAASRWPRRLHLTFDNTSGEAKNNTFYKAMGLLVHYGIFEAVTMSQLMVGHTHDIVDQMFRYAHTLWRTSKHACGEHHGAGCTLLVWRPSRLAHSAVDCGASLCIWQRVVGGAAHHHRADAERDEASVQELLQDAPQGAV